MGDKISRFEEIIGDVDAFHLMLEGALKEWTGTYDVLLADTGDYLFRSKEWKHFRPFCRELRSKQQGEERCRKCDQDAATRAVKDGPIVYACHAGLIDAAVPILIAGELVATTFCGQVRSMQETIDQECLRKAQQLESELGFAQGELVSLWQQVPQISESEISKTKDIIWKLVNYISKLGYARLELQQAHKRDQQRLAESEALEKAARDLSGLAGEWDEFWGKVNQVLEQMTEVIGASCGMVMIPEGVPGPQGKVVVKATSRLLVEHFKGRAYSFYDEAFRKVVEEGEIATMPFKRFHDPDTICGSIRRFAPSLAAELDKVVLAGIRLGDEQVGILLFLLKKGRDTSGSLPIQEEKGLLVQLASLIGTASHNCSLYQARQREMRLRRAWLEQVTHELVAPLHGLQGYAENAWTRLRRWEDYAPQHFTSWTPDEIRWWRYSLESVVWSSHYAARLARNLAWIVYIDRQRKENLDFEIAEDVGGLLIKCARDFQGIARQRRLHKVVVNTESVAPFNGRLRINDDLFRQAVSNLLDNAVKYADPGTDVLIEGEVVGAKAEFRVINQGIRLYPEEAEAIFEYEYRGKEARRRYPIGTGIGLTVARQVIELHGGMLTARPSEPIGHGWQTTFVISLPIHPDGYR